MKLQNGKLSGKIKARLRQQQQQPQIDQEATKSQLSTEQEIAAASTEIQEKRGQIDANSDSTSNLATNPTTDHKFNFTRSVHKSSSPEYEIDDEEEESDFNFEFQPQQQQEESTEIADQAGIQNSNPEIQ
ncbi:hypothetical protein AAHE18_15G276400 [Arachis hypogaea]|nr:uncharacterized protein DS421_15g523180 [Arachis hypogaea]